MELKEAREIAVEIEEFGLAYTTNKIKEAAIILNNRITEFEVRQDELVKELCETIAYHINPIKPPPPGMALALWKIKRPVIAEAK